MESQPYKIVSLHSENFANLKVVDITPGKDGVTLSGANEAGKSNILDVILSTLGGKTIVDPIRHGEERAVNIVNLGEISVKRVWTKKGDYRDVYTADGAVYKSPAELLSKIKSAIGFDPMLFARMSESAKGKRDQRELLMKLVGLTFKENDEKRQGYYTDKTVQNKEIKALEIQLKQLSPPEEGLPEKEISIADELKKVRALEEKQQAYGDYLKEGFKVDEGIKFDLVKIDSYDREIKDLKARIELLEGEKVKAKAHTEELKRVKSELQPPEKITDHNIEIARQKIGEIEQTNIEIRAGNRYLAISKNLAEARAAGDAIIQKISTLDKEKISKVAACKFPIEKLGVDDEGVVYDGTPFERISTGKQTAISTAIAMALNPKLHVIIIKDASLLDSKNKKIIFDMAKEKKGEEYQVWMEVTDESGKVGIYVEDGEVKAIDGKEVPEAEV